MNKKDNFALIVISLIVVMLATWFVVFNLTNESVEATETTSCEQTPVVQVKSYKEIEPASPVVSLVSTEKFFPLSDYERSVVEHIVAGEARGESFIGQKLVAQCILDACILDGLQPSQVRTKYSYGGWSNEVTDSVKEAVSEIFDDGELAVQAPILYFYNPNYYSSWHESQRFILEEGNHRFFARW